MTWKTAPPFHVLSRRKRMNWPRFEEQRLAALECLLGSKLPRIGTKISPDDVDQDETVLCLLGCSGYRKSQRKSRAIFLQQCQIVTKDKLDYVTELCHFVKLCGFIANKELILDWILTGCRVNRISEIPLQPGTTTFADALEIAQTVERAVLKFGLVGTNNKFKSAAKVGMVRVRLKAIANS